MSAAAFGPIRAIAQRVTRDRVGRKTSVEILSLPLPKTVYFRQQPVPAIIRANWTVEDLDAGRIRVGFAAANARFVYDLTYDEQRDAWIGDLRSSDVALADVVAR